jgi:hypothetical protein
MRTAARYSSRKEKSTGIAIGNESSQPNSDYSKSVSLCDISRGVPRVFNSLPSEAHAMKRSLLLACLVLSLLLIGGTEYTASKTSPAVRPDDLQPTCSHPHFPAPNALGIDNECGNEGNAGKEAAQNTAKNNFCPVTQTPTNITIAGLKTLQGKVETNPDINFGSSGPTTDRSPLTDLGEGRLVRLKAFVLKARQEGGESVNCKGHVADEDSFHDIHLSFVDAQHRPHQGDTESITDKKECTGIVAEMSPHHRPGSWTESGINKVAKAGALVRITGQQFFDSSHVPCKNGAPVGSNPKRVSLWEIHPIYAFEVCIKKCSGAGQWQSLEKWLQQH